MLEKSHPAAALSKARRLVHQYGRAATCWQILDPSLAYWFCADGKGVVGYATFRRVRVVAGEPVCPPGRLVAVGQAVVLGLVDEIRRRPRHLSHRGP